MRTVKPTAPRPIKDLIHAAAVETLLRKPSGNDGAISARRFVQRFSDLSEPRRALVRVCQFINWGQIQHLVVRKSDPVFSPPPLVLVDIKLDSHDGQGPRPEVELADFVLCDEVCRLMAQLSEINEGTVDRIEVRAGIARRIVYNCPLTAVRP
jgi:hypothetical protein